MKKRGERVLGPYEQHNGHRVIEVDARGERTSRLFDTAAEAERFAELLRAELAHDDHTTATALIEYRKHLVAKGNKDDSTRQTIWLLGLLFHEPAPLLTSLTPKRCRALYDEFRSRPMKRTQQPPSVDTHRSALAQAGTFIGWCLEQGWLRGANPFAEIEGIGKRRPRGKSLGRSGAELRVKETRAWFAKALELADEDDAGAIAGLVALLLGMRASEIVSRKVADLDDDEAAGDLLWIPCSKTPAGRRTLEVPDVLRPHLLMLAEAKTPNRFLFECEREQDAIGKPHKRDWVIDQVHRICDLAKVPRVTAHAMRGQLATLTSERGLAGHLIAATLGHEDVRTSMTAYARPGSAQAGAARLGLKVLNGGVQVRRKSAI